MLREWTDHSAQLFRTGLGHVSFHRLELQTKGGDIYTLFSSKNSNSSGRESLLLGNFSFLSYKI
jgi:hypothetical protein